MNPLAPASLAAARELPSRSLLPRGDSLTDLNTCGRVFDFMEITFSKGVSEKFKREFRAAALLEIRAAIKEVNEARPGIRAFDDGTEFAPRKKKSK